MLLIAYLYGIKSERRLEEKVPFNLAYCCFLVIITVRRSSQSDVARATCPDQQSHSVFLVNSYFDSAGFSPYTSLMERFLDGSILSMSILYES